MISLNLDSLYAELEKSKHRCGVVETCGVDPPAQTNTRLQTPQTIPLVPTIPCGVDCSDPDQEAPDATESPLEASPEVQALLTWTSGCRGGENWKIPLHLLSEVEELRAIANKSFRQRNPRLYALREFEDQLCCKVWVLGDSWPNHRFGTR